LRLRTLALSLVPGAAHVDLGRAGRGLLFFSLFAFWANAALVAPLVLGLRGARAGGLLAAAGIWVVALYDAVRLAARTAPPPAPKPGDVPVKKDVGKPVA
jgi:hypothetical protein